MSGREVLPCLYREHPELFSTREYPTVTICVPIWNRIWCIDEFLQSILNMDYPKDKIAIVFVDNYSIDGTIEKIEAFIKEYVKQYHFIQLIIQKTNDPEARNVALKEAVGEFCLFWDTDMILIDDKEKLKRFVRYLQIHPDVGVISGAGQGDMAKKNLYEQIMYSTITNGFCLGFALFRRSVFDKVGFFSPLTPTTCDLELASRFKMHRIGMFCETTKPFHHIKKESSVAKGFKAYLCYLRRAYHDGADYQYDLLLKTRDKIHLARILVYAVFPLIIVSAIFLTWLILPIYFVTLLLRQFRRGWSGKKLAVIAFLFSFPAGILQAYGYILTRIWGKPRVSKKRYGYLDYGEVNE